MRAIGVIPARYKSSRFPGKALADICGKPMIQRVYEQASKANLDRVLVATDDDRIYAVVDGFGGECCMTSQKHESGTDRIAEVARSIGPAVNTFVNIQGDEPLIDPVCIDAVVDRARYGYTVNAVFSITNELDWLDPNIVKVIVGESDRILCYSRQPVPCDRECGFPVGHTFANVGLYAYSYQVLQAFACREPSLLESIERIEQLRLLEMGFYIKAQVVPYASIGVDTPKDLERVRSFIATEVT